MSTKLITKSIFTNATEPWLQLFKPLNRTGLTGTIKTMNDSIYKKIVGESAQDEMKCCIGVTKAICRLYYAFQNTGSDLSGVAKLEDGSYVFNYLDCSANEFNLPFSDLEKAPRIYLHMDVDGSLKGCTYNGNNYGKYILKETQYDNSPLKHSSCAIFFAVMAKIFLNSGGNQSELEQEIYTLTRNIFEYMDEIENDVYDHLELLNTGLRLLENAMYSIANYEARARKEYGSEVINNFNSLFITEPMIPYEEPHVLNNDEIVTVCGSLGDYSRKNNRNVKSGITAKAKKLTLGEIIKQDPTRYSFGATLSAEDEMLVPCRDSLYPDETILTKVKIIKESSDFIHPIRNIALEGPSGTGKSTMCEMIAQLLHLPYRYIDITPDTTVDQLYINLLPNTKKNSLDFLDDEGNDADFVAVESELIKALRAENGCVVEIREANLARKKGLMAALNSLCDDTGMVHLMTGETIKRHPNTVIIMTYNDEYEGTQKMNEALLSRFTLKGKINFPTDEVLLERVLTSTSFSDESVIRKMINCIKDIRETLKDNGEPGVVSVRELMAWADCTTILNSPYEAALNTVVYSGSVNEEVIPLILNNIEKYFTKEEYIQF